LEFEIKIIGKTYAAINQRSEETAERLEAIPTLGLIGHAVKGEWGSCPNSLVIGS